MSHGAQLSGVGPASSWREERVVGRWWVRKKSAMRTRRAVCVAWRRCRAEEAAAARSFCSSRDAPEEGTAARRGEEEEGNGERGEEDMWWKGTTGKSVQRAERWGRPRTQALTPHRREGVLGRSGVAGWRRSWTGTQEEGDAVGRYPCLPLEHSRVTCSHPLSLR